MNDFLPIFWFVIIMIFWLGYLFLDGFDLGVGMLVKFKARTDNERRVMLNSIGPVWDGNEVWLVTAVGAMFAAMPMWYAGLLSALYLPFLFILVGLIFRATAIEYRGKVDSVRWRTNWDWALALGSLCAAFWVGVVLGTMTTGLPLDTSHNRVGGPFAWFSWGSLIGGIAVVCFSLSAGSAFVALRTKGTIRAQYQTYFDRYVLILGLPMVIWLILVSLRANSPVGWIMTVLTVLTLIAAFIAARAHREGWQFAFNGMAIIFTIVGSFFSMFPSVLPSTINPAFDLTVRNAASAPYTLMIVTIAGLVGLPLVILYQSWTYWVFRQRLSSNSIPKAHPVFAAIKAKVMLNPEETASK